MSNETLNAEELGNKLPQAVKEMKAGKAARVGNVERNPDQTILCSEESEYEH